MKKRKPSPALMPRKHAPPSVQPPLFEQTVPASEVCEAASMARMMGPGLLMKLEADGRELPAGILDLLMQAIDTLEAGRRVALVVDGRPLVVLNVQR